jgi:hypothetical protein
LKEKKNRVSKLLTFFQAEMAMTKFVQGFALAVATWSALIPAAYASELNVLMGSAEGKVLVAQGDGFSPSVVGMSLSAGDKVFVGDQSSATLVYPNCSISLSSGTVFTVPASATCAKGETIALVDGVVVTPVSGDPNAVKLNGMIKKYSQRQQSGNAALSGCLGPKVAEMKDFRNFWLRNPGIDPTEMIGEFDVDAQTCGNGRVVKTASFEEQPKAFAPKTVKPQVITQQVPAANSSALGGASGKTVALVGAGVLAAGAIGAIILLSKDDSKPASPG